MKTKAMFLHKLPEMKTLDCEIEKIVPLSPSEYAKFYQQLLGDYDFITDNNELMGMKDGTAYCILVMNEELDEGILVNSGGSGFARNVSFFPNVSAYLQAQNQKMTQHEKGLRFSSSAAEESPDAVVRQVTPSLLAYGEKVERYVDACVVQALDGYDDQASYDFSYAELRDGFDGGGLDKDVFMAMLQARPEVVDMDVRGDAVGVVLSLESIQEHEDSKRRILTQDDVVIMHAKHTLWRYDVGGKQADFVGCRLSGLDLHEMCFDGADFHGTLIENCNLRGLHANDADFCDARIINCEVAAFSADDANLDSAHIENCTVDGEQPAVTMYLKQSVDTAVKLAPSESSGESVSEIAGAEIQFGGV